MKKVILKSAVVSAVITLVIFGINTVCACTSGTVPIGMTSWGGEVRSTIGIGWSAVQHFPLLPLDEMPESPIISVFFEPVSVIIFFLLLWAVFFLIFRRKYKSSRG